MMQAVAATSSFPLADRAAGGLLGSFISEARDADLSFEEIAFQLREKFDITVSAATVRRWFLNEVEAKAS